MENQRKSFYEEMKAGGMSRKDFLKFCTTMAALLGLESSGVGQIVKALETKPGCLSSGSTSRNAPAAASHSSVRPILSLPMSSSIRYRLITRRP